MEEFEILKLRLCKGLFDGIVSDYILAVIKNTKSILAEPTFVEILDDSLVMKFKDYILAKELKFQINNCVVLPENLHFVYGSVSKFNLNGQYVRKFNNFYSNDNRTVKYKSVEYESVYAGSMPDDIKQDGPIVLGELSPIVYTEISVFRFCGDRRSIADIAERMRTRYYLPYSESLFPSVSRTDFTKDMSKKYENGKKSILADCVYKLYNVRVQPDRKHFFVNLYNKNCVFEEATEKYELCDSVWASELLPYQGHSGDIPEYNSEGLPLGIICGHNVLCNHSFQPRIGTDEDGYIVKKSQLWTFCLISKVDKHGNWVYINGYDPLTQRMLIEEKNYKPTPEAIESEINDIYIEDIDLEEYRHRFKNKDFSNTASMSTPTIEYVDFDVKYEQYSSTTMYPFVCVPLKNSPIMPYRIRNRAYSRGMQEASFEQFLSRYIKAPYEVRSDIGLVNEKGLFYEPDIVIEKKKKPHIHIDIEIDEPYSGNNEPIHYFECENDQKRNKYFVDNGWVVIRFSEKQITLYPKGCLRVIEDVLSSIDSTYLAEEISLNEQIVSESHWTLEQARQMIEADERSKYLGKDIVQKPVSNSGQTFQKQQLTEKEQLVKTEVQTQKESDLRMDEMQELPLSAKTDKKVSWWRRILHYFVTFKNRLK